MLQITFLIKLMKIFNCNRNYILKYEKPNFNSQQLRPRDNCAQHKTSINTIIALTSINDVVSHSISQSLTQKTTCD